MKRYICINPKGEIIHVVAWDKFEAVHKAKRIDGHIYQNNQYTVKIYEQK